MLMSLTDGYSDVIPDGYGFRPEPRGCAREIDNQSIRMILVICYFIRRSGCRRVLHLPFDGGEILFHEILGQLEHLGFRPDRRVLVDGWMHDTAQTRLFAAQRCLKHAHRPNVRVSTRDQTSLAVVYGL